MLALARVLPSGLKATEFTSSVCPVVRDSHEVLRRLGELRALAGGHAHVELIAACLERLEMFRLSAQVPALEALLAEATSRPARVAPQGEPR